MKIQGVLALLVVVIVLGCIEPEVTSFSPNGVFLSFSATPEVYGNGMERVEASIIAQNVGDSVATNVRADLFNYNGLTGPYSANLGALEAPGKDYPGESQDHSFVLNVPQLGIDLHDTIELGVRVSYDYSTFGKADIPVIPRQDWKSKEQYGVSYPIEQDYSSGPIAIQVEPSKSPIVVSSTSDDFGLRIIIDNTGTGRLVNDSLSTASIEVPAGITLSNSEFCDFNGTLTQTNRALSINSQELLKLTQGKRKTLICRFNVTDTGIENTYGFHTLLTYRYQVDAFTPITIIGTEPE